MSLFTEDMRMITAVVLEESSDEVIKALLQLGALDFVRITGLSADQMAKLSHKNPNMNKTGIIDMRHRIDTLFRQGGLSKPNSDLLDVKMMTRFELKDYRAFLDKLSRTLSSLKDQQKSFSQLEQSYKEIHHYLDEGHSEYIEIHVGKIQGSIDNLRKRLNEYSALVAENNGIVSTMSLRRDSENINKALDAFSWTESEESEIQKIGSDTVKEFLDAQIVEAEERKAELEKQVSAKINEQQKSLLEMWCNLRLHELSDQIRSYFSYTKNTTLFSGWVPAKLSEAVEAAIYEASNGMCVIDWTEINEAPPETIPVSMKSPRVLSPFAELVKNYGTPAYGSVNPIPFVAVAYLTMFLLMFADIGQGIVIFLIAFLVERGYKKNPDKKDGIIPRSATRLIEYIGIVAALGGIVFGSNFGYPTPFRPLWFSFHNVVEGTPVPGTPVQNVYDILKISVIYGIVVIFVGLLINWVNLVRRKEFITMIFDRQGLCGGAMYATGIYMGFQYTATGFKSLPSDPWITPVLLIGAFGLLLKEPLLYIQKKRNGREVPKLGSFIGSVIMDWVLELLETFTGYLSNTLSFFRVAGYGIAHVSLMAAFEVLAEMPGEHTVWGILILVFGNVLVIALEGLSSGIQALRLNYYEFFTKFFNGTGIAYSPVSLHSKDQ